MIHIISKDAWRIITNDLDVQDLLQLRGTCRHMNGIVKSLNARWYRAHQWFLSRKGTKSKVKSAVKCHTAPFCYRCIPHNHQLVRGASWYERTQSIRAGLDEGKFTEADCNKKTCWKYRVPRREQEIPVDKKHYKPKRNRYIYWYLIECYRHYKAIEKRRVEFYEYEVRQARLKLQTFRRTIEVLREKINTSITDEAEYDKKLRLERAKYDKNKIFEGTRINGYNGV